MQKAFKVSNTPVYGITVLKYPNFWWGLPPRFLKVCVWGVLIPAIPRRRRPCPFPSTNKYANYKSDIALRA